MACILALQSLRPQPSSHTQRPPVSHCPCPEHLDAGHEAAKQVVRRLWASRIASVDADARDAKTALQEWAQARAEPPPQYVEVARSGPDHAPVFTIEARLSSGPSEQATAGSKRQAEQAAAAALLQKVTS